MTNTTMPYRYEGGWQDRTVRRLNAMGLGFAFMRGQWWPINGGTVVAGPFNTTTEFDAWLDDRERVS